MSSESIFHLKCLHRELIYYKPQKIAINSNNIGVCVFFVLELASNIYFVFLFVCLFACFSFQGCIPLHGCQVNEISANPDEPGRHLFEIVPGELE